MKRAYYNFGDSAKELNNLAMHLKRAEINCKIFIKQEWVEQILWSVPLILALGRQRQADESLWFPAARAIACSETLSQNKHHHHHQPSRHKGGGVVNAFWGISPPLPRFLHFSLFFGPQDRRWALVDDGYIPPSKVKDLESRPLWAPWVLELYPSPCTFKFGPESTGFCRQPWGGLWKYSFNM